MGRSGYSKGSGHPVVHANVQVAEDEYRRLQGVGKVEGFPAELETFRRIARQQHHLLAVAMAEETGEEDVALAGARWQAGAGAHAGDIPDDNWNLCDVGEAGKLRHQADAGAAGGSQGARARPAGADDHGRRRRSHPRPG